MKRIQALFLVLPLALGGLGAAGQTVKGNEAVSMGADGGKRVQTPPLPTSGPIRSARPCMAAEGCHAGAWLMVETDGGLMECTEAYARPGTCRASTYGTDKRMRVWVVKTGPRWLQCQYPDLGSKCIDLFARPPGNLPYPALQ